MFFLIKIDFSETRCLAFTPPAEKKMAQGGLSSKSKRVVGLYFLGDFEMLFTSLLKVKGCVIIQ